MDALLQIPQIKPILATTNRSIDHPLVEIAQSKGIATFCGDLNNVALRVADCIRHFEVECFARINGDSPFLAKSFLLDAFAIMEEPSVDFVTNLVPRAFPYGISVEVMRSSFYLAQFPQLQSSHYQEHLTSYFYEHLDQFKVHKIAYPYGNDHHIRLVVDTPADKQQIEQILAQIPVGEEADFLNLVTLYKNTFKA